MLPDVVPSGCLALYYPDSGSFNPSAVLPPYSLGDEAKVLHATRTDQIQVNVGSATRAISIADCSTYQDVAELIKKAVFHADQSASWIKLSCPDDGKSKLRNSVPIFPIRENSKVAHARGNDQIQVKIGESIHNFSIAGCSSYRDVANIIRKVHFPAASCAEQIVFLNQWRIFIDLGKTLPTDSPSARVLHASMIVKKVNVIGYDSQKNYTLDTVTSDGDILLKYRGLTEIHDGEPVGPPIFLLHLLKDGASYMPFA